MPVDRLIETRKENGSGNDRNPARDTLDDNVVGGQQKQSPGEGIPEGGPIPLHRDTTIHRNSGAWVPLRYAVWDVGRP